MLNEIDRDHPILLWWELLHVSDDGELLAHLLESILLHLFRFVKVVQNKMSRTQSMGQSSIDLWKINSDIYSSKDSRRRKERVKKTHEPRYTTQTFCLRACEARSPVRRMELILWNVFTPHKRREKKRHREKQGQKILLTRRLLNRRPLLLFPFLFPSLWSFNPNGKRLFHVSTRGATVAFFPGLHLCRKHPHLTTLRHQYTLTHPSKAISPLISC